MPTQLFRLYKFAECRGFSSSDRLASISLGQGQGAIAEAAIASAIDKGETVLLYLIYREFLINNRNMGFIAKLPSSCILDENS